MRVPSRGIDAAKSQKLKAKHQTPNAHNTEHRTPASYRTPNACIMRCRISHVVSMHNISAFEVQHISSQPYYTDWPLVRVEHSLTLRGPSLAIVIPTLSHFLFSIPLLSSQSITLGRSLKPPSNGQLQNAENAKTRRISQMERSKNRE